MWTFDGSKARVKTPEDRFQRTFSAEEATGCGRLTARGAGDANREMLELSLSLYEEGLGLQLAPSYAQNVDRCFNKIPGRRALLERRIEALPAVVPLAPAAPVDACLDELQLLGRFRDELDENGG